MLADAAGFTSKKAYEMGIPAIGIVAVLVANVAFVAWVQVPGAAPLAMLYPAGLCCAVPC